MKSKFALLPEDGKGEDAFVLQYIAFYVFSLDGSLIFGDHVFCVRFSIGERPLLDVNVIKACKSEILCRLEGQFPDKCIEKLAITGITEIK